MRRDGTSLEDHSTHQTYHVDPCFLRFTQPQNVEMTQNETTEFLLCKSRQRLVGDGHFSSFLRLCGADHSSSSSPTAPQLPEFDIASSCCTTWWLISPDLRTNQPKSTRKTHLSTDPATSSPRINDLCPVRGILETNKSGVFDALHNNILCTHKPRQLSILVKKISLSITQTHLNQKSYTFMCL